MKNLPLKPADILIPDNIDLNKWAVVACDQFTSEKDYWEKVEEYVKNYPSTFNIIFPECYLGDNNSERIQRINKYMSDYFNNNLFRKYEDCFIFVKRKINNKIRYGLMVTLDLEEYEPFSNSSIIRPTEGTISSRIPPRKQIRENALLECPHIMVLISDKNNNIFGTLKNIDDSKKIYQTDLMFNGGEVSGYLVDGELKNTVIDYFSKLDPFIFAVGDGNHSLATAKACYEDLKKQGNTEKLKNTRYCLVEIENIFDDAVVFSPIHRLVFDTDINLFNSYLSDFSLKISEIGTPEFSKSSKSFIVIKDGKYYLYEYENDGLTVATVDIAIDKLVKEGHKIDYIHEPSVLKNLTDNTGNFGVILPNINKDNFFTDIINYGTYPRKTFSIGHPEEKRYYLECRYIGI